MNSPLEKYQKQLGSIASSIINLFPYLTYILLMKQEENIVIAALPLVIFYAFRRTALFIFSSLRHDYNKIGWIGLTCACLGYLFGMLGPVNLCFYDLSAILAGIGAATFPAAWQQLKIISKYEQVAKHKGNNLLLLMPLVLLIFIALTFNTAPGVSFFLLFLASICGMIGFYYDPARKKTTSKLTLNWKTTIPIIFLFLSTLLVYQGRKVGTSQLILASLIFFAVFLISLVILLVVNRNSILNKAPKNLYFRIMMYGICAQFWITYSAIFIIPIYGSQSFMWIIGVYILGMILGKKFVSLLQRIFKTDLLSLSVLGICVGILATFYFPTYFLGIFIIRSFASYEMKKAVGEYNSITGNYQNSYFLSYYIISLAALITQMLMWFSLFVFSKSKGLSVLLQNINVNHLAREYSYPIMMTHIVLAVIMIVYALAVLINDKLRKRVNK